MATAESLGGRRVPSSPEPKSNETQTFVGPDGNTIEVIKSISKDALAILKRRGFKSQTRALKEQEEAALAKADATSSQEDETAGEDPEEEGQPRTSTENETAAGPRKATSARRK